MSLVDPAFLFGFLPIFLLVFGLAGRIWGRRAAAAVLALATIVFCIPYGVPFLVILAASTAVNFWVFNGLLAEKSDQFRTRLFWIALVLNFGLLFVFKYGNLFSYFFGGQDYVDMLSAAVPVTLSFLTFQRMVLILEAYQRQPEMTALTGDSGGVARFGAFNLMFSNLLIGPIAYASELAPQMEREDFGRLRRVNFEVGLTLLAIGFVKKIWIADSLGLWVVDPLFIANEAGKDLVPAEAFVGMLGYYAQLYFDFSGYSNIAIGISRLIGIRLPINFNSPLRSVGIIDFYKRWHITLTRVIARLMFTPLALSGTRFSAARGMRGWKANLFSVWLPLFINFEIIGLWHGAKMTYLVFGAFHGIWFIAETQARKTKRWKEFKKSTPDWLRLRLGQLIFFVPMLLSFTLFRCGNLSEFSHILGQLWGDWLGVLSSARGRVLTTKIPFMYLSIAYATIWLLPNAYEMMDRYRPGIISYSVPSTTPRFLRWKWRPVWYWAIPFAVGVFVVIGYLNRPVPFIYGGF